MKTLSTWRWHDAVSKNAHRSPSDAAPHPRRGERQLYSREKLKSRTTTINHRLYLLMAVHNKCCVATFMLVSAMFLRVQAVSYSTEEKLMDFSQTFIIYRFTVSINYRLNQRCINPECHAASMTKFCMVAPKTRWSSIWKWLHVTLLASTEFWGGSRIFKNVCAHLHWFILYSF